MYRFYVSVLRDISAFESFVSTNLCIYRVVFQRSIDNKYTSHFRLKNPRAYIQYMHPIFYCLRTVDSASAMYISICILALQ